MKSTQMVDDLRTAAREIRLSIGGGVYVKDAEAEKRALSERLDTYADIAGGVIQIANNTKTKTAP